MDNLNNNFPNTQTPNPVNDNTQSPSTDYNSMQPQSNPLGVMSDTSTQSTTPMDNSNVEALSGTPAVSETPSESSAPVTPPPSPSPEIQPSIGNIPPAEATPVNGFSPSTVTTEEVAPLTSDAMSTLDSVDSTQPETTAPVESTMPSSDTFTSSSPVEQTVAPVENSAPAFNTNFPDTSLNLNEPLTSTTESTSVQEDSEDAKEVVNTLGDTDKGEGGSNAVVIVLVVIILLLLAGIGYFGYQIFFA